MFIACSLLPSLSSNMPGRHQRGQARGRPARVRRITSQGVERAVRAMRSRSPLRQELDTHGITSGCAVNRQPADPPKCRQTADPPELSLQDLLLQAAHQLQVNAASHTLPTPQPVASWPAVPQPVASWPTVGVHSSMRQLYLLLPLRHHTTKCIT
jgi:hypothetical protein